MLNEFLNGKSIEKPHEYVKEFSENTPFSFISINDFLKDDIAQKLLDELQKERYYLEDHDLYQFNRTVDLENSENDFILQFRKFLLSDDFIKYIEDLTGSEIDSNDIDLHSLKLTDTNYLLCHDDDVGKREIAFIINLSKDWLEEYDGKLELFESENGEPTKISKSILPEFNQFNIFKVTPGKSFHQISEIIGDNERISISGWYYKK